MPAPLGLRILCLDDDDAIRESMAELLAIEGFEVVLGSTVEGGLAALRQGGIHLVLTDYGLPDGTGTELLRTAQREGLLEGVASLMITAHPEPEAWHGAKVFRKPLDVDHLLRHVSELLAPARDAEIARARQALESSRGPGPAMDEPRIEFVLYISAASASSLRAVRNMQRLLAEYDARRVGFTICDLSKEEPASLDEDRIAFTPTLVKRRPEPKTWILGDLENTRAVTDLLHLSGVERRR
jgi:DNA-binding response OmpR family regulator